MGGSTISQPFAWGDVLVAEGVRFSVAVGAESPDPISTLLRSGQFPHGPVFGLLKHLAPEGGRVLDLGAHVGSFSMAAAAAGFEVASVEASPINVELLRASVARNGFEPRLTVVHAAVGDRAGDLEFHQDGPFGHVVDRGYLGQGYGDHLRVPALTVDDLLSRLGWDRVDFIKMDVEGSEVAALRGMPRLLARRDAPTIFYESNGHTLRFFGESPRNLWRTLEASGFRNFLVETNRLLPVRSRHLQTETVVDYLATKQPLTDSATWRVDRPLSRLEVISRALRTCASTDVHERAYIASAINAASLDIRIRLKIRRALETLRQDPAPEVRAAASLVPDRAGWFFKSFLKHKDG